MLLVAPKIWYYDGNIIVYSRRMINEYIDEHDPDDPDESQLTEEDRNVLDWDESRLSPPRAFYIRGKVPNTIKDKLNGSNTEDLYITIEYAEQCTLTPFLEGWTSAMWNLILNGAMYD